MYGPRDFRRKKLAAETNQIMGSVGPQALLDGSSVFLPLTHTAVPQRGSITPSFTRATTETGQKWDEAGYLDFTALAGEVVFKGARRERNLLTFTEDFSNAAWLKSFAGAGSVPVVTADQEANPIAGTSIAFADKVVFAAPGAGDLSMLQQSFTGAAGNAYLGAFYVKAFAAGDVGKVILFRHAAGGGYTQVTLTAAYQRVSLKETGIGAVTFDVGLRPTFSSSSGTVSIYLTAAQLEDVTGQTTQTASEYVSVGVESAPAYHGSMVDGVKCYDTDRSGNPISTSGSYPLVGYVPWEARTNKVTYSEDFTNWTDSGAAVTANTHTSPNGQTTADTLTRVAGAGDARFIVVSFTGDAAKAVSVWVKKGTSPSSLIALLDSTAAAYRLWCDLTWSGNTPVTAFTNGSLIEAEEYPNNLWRLKFLTESVVAANANRLYVYPGRAGSANGQTVIVFGGQGEDAISVGPYIPTTTLAVARNADLLTYTGADVALLKTLACTFSRGVGVSNVGIACALSDGSLDDYIEMYLGSATVAGFEGVASSVVQWNEVASNAYVPGTISKMAQTWAIGNVKMDKDGTAQAVDVSLANPVVTQLNVGHVGTSYVFNGPVNHIYGWTRNLSQSELGAVDR